MNVNTGVGGWWWEWRRGCGVEMNGSGEVVWSAHVESGLGDG